MLRRAFLHGLAISLLGLATTLPAWAADQITVFAAASATNAIQISPHCMKKRKASK